MRVIKGDHTGTIGDAMALERAGDNRSAANLYERLHKASPASLKIIERLIILYRKLKEPVKELTYIDAAINLHRSYYTAGRNADKLTANISKKLNKMLGHVDNKGRPAFKPVEIVKLELRRERLVSKMAPSKK